MSEEEGNSATRKRNKLVGPGLGLIIMGVAYLVWWISFIEYALMDPRWTHNIAYAIIILNVGLAWYHKTPISRTITGTTEVLLFTKEDWAKYKKNKVSNVKSIAVGSGIAHCSSKDNYDKTLGRIIATSRALKNYRPDVFENIRTSSKNKS